MAAQNQTVLIIGGGTAGCVLAARLSELPGLSVTLLEAGPDDSVYDEAVLNPAMAAQAWGGAAPIAPSPLLRPGGAIPMFQGRLLGGTSAVNGLATLRGLPTDYDSWAAAGLDGWGWADVVDTFIAAESDADFGATPLHGADGPLPVRRWQREEFSHAQRAFYDGMVALGEPVVTDINDPAQLPGIGVFPVTIDAENRRVSVSLAYLTEDVRARDNLHIRTDAEVTKIEIDRGRAIGVQLATGETLTADQIIVSAGAIFSPALLMRSGIGPLEHLQDHDISVHADLPVGETLSDHLGPGLQYQHAGPRGGTAGPAQSLLVGSSNGSDVDYHLFPIATAPSEAQTNFMMAAFLMRSSGQGSVRLGDSPDAAPVVMAPPMPQDTVERLRPGFSRIAAWEQSDAFAQLNCQRLEPLDLNADDAVSVAMERNLVSYGHMTSSCPMGRVLDADCRVLGIHGLRVVDASVMPSIPSGNTYLGCVMVAERVARKIKSNMD